ncbi:MAG: cell division protein FtsZ, partial [Treponema sp.]|nr:cell division protein FtsZ [Treponema sp.]
MGIKLIGAGGFGTRIAGRLAREEGLTGISFAAVDTDRHELNDSELEETLKIGPDTPFGGGTEGRVSLGLKAAQNALPEITRLLTGTDILIIAAGFGGGTGTGAAPLIARIAHENGIRVCTILKHPFAFEGAQKSEYSLEGIRSIKDS